MSAWWVRLLAYARPHRGRVATLIVVTVGGAAAAALKPWPLKLIVDSVLPGKPLPPRVAWLEQLPGAHGRIGLLAWLASGTMAIFLVSWVLRSLRTYAETGLSTRMTWKLGEHVFDRAQRLSPSFHAHGTTGDLIQRVTKDTRCVRDLLLGVLVPLLTSAATLAVMLRVMWRLDRALSLVALLIGPLLALCVRLFSDRLQRFAYAEARVQGETLAMAEQTLTALPMVQAFGAERHEDERFRALTRKSGASSLRSIAANLQLRLGVDTLTALGTAGVMLAGGLRVLENRLSVGDLLVFISYLQSLYGPLESFAYLSSGLAGARASARRVFEVLDSAAAVPELPGAPALRVAEGIVRFEEVTFGYEKDRPVLHGVSLEVAPGECVALVGPTGAGKTSLASLLPRFHDPWQGRVTVDGQDLRGVTLASLRAHLALVPQEPLLLPVSIAENIAYGRPEATREEVVAAAVAAEADAFVRRLPEGYDTVVGARGATLSVGERQRLSVARALLRDAPILLLDEPTASLDAENERKVVAALRRLVAGRTCLVIAHRPSTVALATRVVTFEGGRIVGDALAERSSA